ncbi:hypothetical protein SDC9_203992 [bioreactor metagenome]|uniref:Uncharacterized protein n=1 Tax=bioreactor metagenome TaxID=1076179 RepID=A0A645IYN5_9ZZZZ
MISVSVAKDHTHSIDTRQDTIWHPPRAVFECLFVNAAVDIYTLVIDNQFAKNATSSFL